MNMAFMGARARNIQYDVAPLLNCPLRYKCVKATPAMTNTANRLSDLILMGKRNHELTHTKSKQSLRACVMVSSEARIYEEAAQHTK